MYLYVKTEYTNESLNGLINEKVTLDISEARWPRNWCFPAKHMNVSLNLTLNVMLIYIRLYSFYYILTIFLYFSKCRKNNSDVNKNRVELYNA